MSTTDELLKEMLEDVEEYATPVTDDDLQFWIDEHLRVISIPKNGVVAGVEGDKNVNKIKFGMNRYYHGFDMSTFSGRILYSNAKGNKNYYNITDMQASGSAITFSWLVDADAVQYMGKTAFVVYLFKTQGSELRQKFYSTLATLKVLEGMEVDSAVPVEKQTDIIERMKEEISAYAEEVKKSLPADYTAMTEQVSSLKEEMDAFQKKINDGELASMLADSSIEEKKLAPDARLWNTQKLSIISNNYQNSAYTGDLFDQFTANINVFTDYIDTSSRKALYYRIYKNNTVMNGKVGIRIGCYDADKKYLYTMHDSADYADKFLTLRYVAVNENLNGQTVRVKAICRVDIADEVKFVKFGIPGNSNFVPAFYGKLVVSYDDFTDYDATEKVFYNEKLIAAIKNAGGSSSGNIKTMVMIGDSLTNWGGGNDTEDGFLKIVHDKTGVVTKNEGLAGAWWQTGEGQTQCGVTRVDTLIAEKRKYDLYCFMLGTNAGSTTDTGESSTDTSTMSGAIRYCMEHLKAYDPKKPILICLPPQRAEGNENQEKVNKVIKAIVESYSVKTLDVYHHSGIVPNTTIANIGYLSDGLHLGENGITMLGNLLASEVKYLLCF